MESLYGACNELPKGEKVEALQRGEVLRIAESKVCVSKGFWIQEFVFNYLNIANEFEKRRPVPVAEAVEFEFLVLAAEKSGETILVEHVVIAKMRNPLLKHAQAIGVDGPDEHRA
jgi:hypothetical protein